MLFIESTFNFDAKRIACNVQFVLCPSSIDHNDQSPSVLCIIKLQFRLFEVFCFFQSSLCDPGWSSKAGPLLLILTTTMELTQQWDFLSQQEIRSILHFKDLFLIMYMGWGRMCTWMQVNVEVRRGHRSPGAGVIGSCEPCDVGTGSLTPVLYKNSRHS